jgi:hypothetical protein
VTYAWTSREIAINVESAPSVNNTIQRLNKLEEGMSKILAYIESQKQD